MGNEAGFDETQYEADEAAFDAKEMNDPPVHDIHVVSETAYENVVNEGDGLEIDISQTIRDLAGQGTLMKRSWILLV